MSVCLSGFGETWFSRPLYKIELSFFVCTFLLYMNIYSTNILSVSLSVRLQKAKELRYLWMLSSLFLSKNLFYHPRQSTPSIVLLYPSMISRITASVSLNCTVNFVWFFYFCSQLKFNHLFIHKTILEYTHKQKCVFWEIFILTFYILYNKLFNKHNTRFLCRGSHTLPFLREWVFQEVLRPFHMPFSFLRK